MANNRLYLGNKKTMCYFLVEKGWSDAWDGGHFNPEMVKEFISTETYQESGLGGKTDLVWFTEYDELYDTFREKGTNLRPDMSQTELDWSKTSL